MEQLLVHLSRVQLKSPRVSFRFANKTNSTRLQTMTLNNIYKIRKNNKLFRLFPIFFSEFFEIFLKFCATSDYFNHYLFAERFHWISLERLRLR